MPKFLALLVSLFLASCDTSPTDKPDNGQALPAEEPHSSQTLPAEEPHSSQALPAEEPDNDEAYSYSQWHTLGTQLKKVKSSGKVLFITNPMNKREKERFREYHGQALLDGLGKRFSFGKIVSPPSMKPPTADAPPIEQFTGEELERLLAQNDDYSVVVFTCQLPWQNNEVLKARLCRGAQFHQLAKDHPDQNFTGNNLPAIALVNPSALTSLAQAMIRERRIDVVVRWKPGHSVDSEPLELPKEQSQISAIRYIMITPKNLSQMIRTYGKAQPRLFIK